MHRSLRRVIAFVLSFVLLANYVVVGAPAWATEEVGSQTNGQDELIVPSGSPMDPTDPNGPANENDQTPLSSQDDSSDPDSLDNSSEGDDQVTILDNGLSSNEGEQGTETPDGTQQGEGTDSEEIQAEAEKDPEDAIASVDAEAQEPSVWVLPHIQRLGWSMGWVKDGKVAGTTGQKLRLEAYRLRVEGQGSMSGEIQYRSHLQTTGWQGWVAGDAMSGTTGKSRRVEAVQIRLTGDLEANYDVYYRVHAQKYGWMAWAKNGECAGTVSKSLRVEALQVVLVKKGGPSPSTAGQYTNVPFVGDECVEVAAHVQKYGWLGAVGNRGVAGTTGKSLRLEAVRASLRGARAPGGVEVSAHCQKYGWMGWVGSGQVAGTTGRSLRMEAIRMRLTGEAASVYDLYYRVHVQKVGWLAWAPEGETAGTTGLSLRAEAVQTMLVPEGAAPPSNEGSATSVPYITTLHVGTSSYVSGAWQGYAWDGGTSGTTGRYLPNQGLRLVVTGTNVSSLASVSYRVHTLGGGWQGWVSDGADAGVGNTIDAFQVRLNGTASRVYDVWYRAHVQSYGWLGWTKNAQSAGTVGLNKRLEAVQVKLVPKTWGAPSPASRPYLDGSLKSGLDAASGARSVVGFGGYSPSGRVLNGLNSAVNDLRRRGYDVGFIMMDLSSHKGVAYNCDALFYGASSIKAPYISSVVNAHPDAVARYSHDITETLFYSWDYNYKNVLAAYGKGPMYTWCSEAGVRSAIADQLPWATYSARELAKMWARSYQLFSQGGAGEQLGKWCERPNVSTIHSTLGGRYRTRSKAGWIDAGGAIVSGVNGGGQFWRVSDDGGIVYARNGAYVMAIMSSVPDNHPMLNGITSAIDAAHSEM